MSDAQVKRIKADELTPDIRNANKGTERGRYALETSLREYGAGRSILVDSKGRIIAGNKTLETAAEMGLDDVLVVQTDGRQIVAVQRMDLDLAQDDKARMLAYADNRVGQLDLDFDPAVIAEDIAAGLDLDLFWQDFELDEILETLQPEPTPGEDTEPEIDKAEELRQKWGVETGQLWQLGDHRLICGDCTDAEVVARVMGGELASLVATSPPYHVGKSYEADNTWVDFLKLISGFSSVAAGVMNKELSYFFVNFSENTNKPMCMSEVYRNCLTGNGLTWHSHRVWKRPSDLPIYASIAPRTCNEIEYLHTYKMGTGKESVRDIKISHRMLWETNGPEKLGHDAAFPVELIEKPIVIYTDEKLVVYEPFSGSGTTIIACENLKRRCRAVEISPGYVAVALERWHQHTGKTPVLIDG